MVAVADRPPSKTSEAGEIAALVDGLLGCTDAELAERLLVGQRMRAELDAAVVAVTDRFDARMVWAGDGHRNGPGWVTARVGVSYAQAKADLGLARDLRAHPASPPPTRTGP